MTVFYLYILFSFEFNLISSSSAVDMWATRRVVHISTAAFIPTPIIFGILFSRLACFAPQVGGTYTLPPLKKPLHVNPRGCFIARLPLDAFLGLISPLRSAQLAL